MQAPSQSKHHDRLHSEAPAALEAGAQQGPDPAPLPLVLRVQDACGLDGASARVADALPLLHGAARREERTVTASHRACRRGRAGTRARG